MTFCQDILDMLSKRHPDTDIFVIGDHHFFHKNILQYSRTEFESVEEMHARIIEAHNRVVKPENIVIFLGDFCFKNSAIEDIVSIMNGHKYLILGNHDVKALEKRYLTLGFEGLYTMPVKIKDSYLSHEPLIKGQRTDLTFQGILDEFVKNEVAVNYHGHIHVKNDNISPAYVNATCEALGYEPILVGRTAKETGDRTKPLFINSELFSKTAKGIYKRNGIDPRVLLDDYVYSTMLESLSDYQEYGFVQGSFGLYKKYGYISHFSDLDISCFYNPTRSKGRNYAALKTISDEMYEHLKGIDGINLEFFKRFSTIRIFGVSLARPTSLFSNCYSDINLILLDCYRGSDFIELRGGCSVEKFLSRMNPATLEDYSFPRFDVKSLCPTGDIVNLILQIMFQEEHSNVKIAAIKKLQYIYKRIVKDEMLVDFMDTFTRFFLRNVALFSSWCRTGEIDYIKAQSSKLSSLIEPYMRLLPEALLEEVLDVLSNPNSKFLEIYEDIVSAPSEDAMAVCVKSMKKIK